MRPQPASLLLVLLLPWPALAVPDICDGDGGLPSDLLFDDADATFGGAPADSRAGAALAMGDLNTDGIDDLIVGLPGQPGWSSGVAVYFGPITDPGALSLGSPDLILSGGPSMGSAGGSLHMGPDLTGDGQPDLLIGGAAGDPVLVVTGRAGWPASVQLSAVATAVIPAPPGASLWGAALGAGDVTGDGLADLVVGAPGGAGQARVYVGPVSGLVAPGTARATIPGAPASELGSAIALDDVNGDGIDDIWLGAPGAIGGAGVTALFLGGPALTGTRPLLTTDLGLVGTSGSRGGSALSTWDGWLYVGAPTADGGAGEVRGVSYLDALTVGTGPIDDVLGERWRGAAGDGAGAAFAIGDLDGRGLPEIIIGAPDDDGGDGALYIYGARSGGTQAFASTRISGLPGSRLGASVVVADATGDLYADLLAGAPGAALPFADGGSVLWQRGGGDVYDEVDAWLDADGDGAGAPGQAVLTCPNIETPGLSLADNDCDDSRDDIFPGAPETCTEAIDHDCDGLLPTDDGDADGFAACDDCDDTDANRSPDADERCNGIDDNCDGLIDDSTSVDATTWFQDGDGDGYGVSLTGTARCYGPPTLTGWVNQGGDCDDATSAISPGAAEICNRIDDDCDGTPDDGAADATGFFHDTDGDGAGDPTQRVDACTQPFSYVRAPTDCDDTDPTIRPGATEVCDGADNDCDGVSYLVGELDASAATSRWTGGHTGNGFSKSHLIADVNGDGTADLVVGEPGEQGRVLVRLGPLRDRPYRGAADADLMLVGRGDTEGFGTTLATGDFNGDGHLDLAIGAPQTRAPEIGQGAVFIFFGPITGSRPDTQADLQLIGPHNRAYTGSALHAADLDGDGVDDLVVGSTGTDNPGGLTNVGAVNLLYGPMQPVRDRRIGLVTRARMYGGERGDEFGAWVTTGDVDGDGRLELAVGAPQATSTYWDMVAGAGRIEIVFNVGSKTGPLPTERTISHRTTAAGIGRAFVLADTNGDGLAELWTGSSRNELIAVPSALLLPDGTDSLLITDSSRVVARWEGPTGARLGLAVVAADLDGDGRDDIATGSPRFDGTGDDLGAVWLMYGMPNLASFIGVRPDLEIELVSRNRGSANARLTGDATRMRFGASLSTGDFNGDGHVDLVVGAPESGGVHLFATGPNGTDTLAGCDTDGDGCLDEIDLWVDVDEGDPDGDGFSNGCDICLGDDLTRDDDGDGFCFDLDVCPGLDDTLDRDGDGLFDCIVHPVLLSLGTRHGCAVGLTDRMECWGDNSLGQAPRWGPRLVDAVAAGDDFSCNITRAGDVRCVGADDAGQAPTQVPGDYVDLTAGGNHACALRSDGHVTCWGDNRFGQAPTVWTGPFLEVSAGGAHTCALRATGQLECRGLDAAGQASPPSGDFFRVNAGSRNTCAIRTSGAITCWGDDSAGQSPSAVPGSWRTVSAGDHHACAISTLGQPTCWGEHGAATVPASVRSSGVSQIDAGSGFTCAATESSYGVCWPAGGGPTLALDLEFCFGDEASGDLDGDDICNDTDPDRDGDGLSNVDEVARGLDPDNPDSDSDMLDDAREVALGTDPLSADTDGDGLRDGREVNTIRTDPLVADTDGDGLSDGEEVRLGTAPRTPDTDGDGIPDGVEVNTLGTDPTDPDTDADGLDDREEVLTYGTDPTNPNTDGDGADDGEEVAQGTDPLVPDVPLDTGDSGMSHTGIGPPMGDSGGDTGLIGGDTGAVDTDPAPDTDPTPDTDPAPDTDTVPVP